MKNIKELRLFHLSRLTRNGLRRRRLPVLSFTFLWLHRLNFLSLWLHCLNFLYFWSATSIILFIGRKNGLNFIGNCLNRWLWSLYNNFYLFFVSYNDRLSELHSYLSIRIDVYCVIWLLWLRLWLVFTGIC
jgi:hypothetical protein